MLTELLGPEGPEVPFPWSAAALVLGSFTLPTQGLEVRSSAAHPARARVSFEGTGENKALCHQPQSCTTHLPLGW